MIWGEGTYIALTRCVDGEKETIIMGAAEVICCFFLEEKIHNRPEISDHFHTHVPEIFSRQKCMGKGRRGVPAVAADLSFHLYMHKNTNKRQHT